MIKNIVFDIGDVLVDFRWRAYMQDLGFSEETIQILADNVVNSELWNELDRGVMDEKEVIGIMKQRTPDYADEIDLFWERIVEICEVFPYTNDFLSRLRNRGYHLYLLSNYPERLFKMHEDTIFTFIPYTDGMIISGRVKMTKPDEGIYRCLLDTYSLKPEECVFIDDKPKNIQAAQKLGIHGIIADNYDQIQDDLEKLLVLP